MTQENEQQSLVSWLATPSAHGGAASVEHIETQISHVFLAGDHALKLKKAIRPAFLDYSSADKRRAAAEEELRVNRRTAPDLYEAVLPVMKDDGGFCIGDGGAGQPVDWLVKMRRFPHDAQFDVMVREDRLHAHHVEDLADALAGLHKDAERRIDHGGAAGMKHHFTWPLETLLSAEELPFDRAALKALGKRLGQKWRRLSPLLEARRRHGFVRHGHGDLHLANVCLFRGRALPFDAIEFSAEIACVDILYDAAFMAMDLIAHDRRDFASLFVSRYLEATRDYGGLACLDFFIAVRALVRTMANSFVTEKQPLARRYFALAGEALQWPARARLVAIGGYSGSGKSTLARALSPYLAPGAGAVHLRSDGIRKRLFGRRPEEALPASAYSADWHRRTYERLYRDSRRALRAGRAVIVDATFLDPGSRDRIAALATATRASFDGLWLDAPADILRRRLMGRGRDASDADLKVLERQLAREDALEDWRRVPAAGDPEEALAAAAGLLGPGPAGPRAGA